MGILSRLMKKNKGEQPQAPAAPKPSPKPAVASGGKKKGGGGVILLLFGLLLGFAGGAAFGSYFPEIGRDLLQLEPLVPQSDVAELQQKVNKLTQEKLAAEKKASAAEKKQDKRDARSQRKPRRNTDTEEYIDEMGTQSSGRDIIRTSDLPTRSVIPRGIQNSEPVALDFARLQMDEAAVGRLTKFTDNGVHFFLAFSCDYCKEGYALASNLHDRYPDMPVGLSFFVDKNEHVLLYAAWLAIRLVDEEESWNFLNFAFNNKNFPNSDLVLQDYENFNPKFNRKDLIAFWTNHKEQLHSLLDIPYEMKSHKGWTSYKLPFVCVHGNVQESKMDIDAIRNAYKGKIQTEAPSIIR